MINQLPNTSWFPCHTNVDLICCECGKATKWGTYELEHLDPEKVRLTGRTLCDDCANQVALTNTYPNHDYKDFGMTHVMVPRTHNEY